MNEGKAAAVLRIGLTAEEAGERDQLQQEGTALEVTDQEPLVRDQGLRGIQDGDRIVHELNGKHRGKMSDRDSTEGPGAEIIRDTSLI